MLDLDQNTDNLLKEFSASGIGISVEGNNLNIVSFQTKDQEETIFNPKTQIRFAKLFT